MDRRRGVGAARRLRVTIDVVIDDDDALQGRIGCDGRSSADFTGWLGLLSGLDHLLTGPGPASDPAAPVDGSDAARVRIRGGGAGGLRTDGSDASTTP